MSRAARAALDTNVLVSALLSTRSAPVSGDAHLLSLAGRITVCSPREVLELLESER